MHRLEKADDCVAVVAEPVLLTVTPRVGRPCVAGGGSIRLPWVVGQSAHAVVVVSLVPGQGVRGDAALVVVLADPLLLWRKNARGREEISHNERGEN